MHKQADQAAAAAAVMHVKAIGVKFKGEPGTLMNRTGTILPTTVY